MATRRPGGHRRHPDAKCQEWGDSHPMKRSPGEAPQDPGQVGPEAAVVVVVLVQHAPSAASGARRRLRRRHLLRALLLRIYSVCAADGRPAYSVATLTTLPLCTTPSPLHLPPLNPPPLTLHP